MRLKIRFASFALTNGQLINANLVFLIPFLFLISPINYENGIEIYVPKDPYKITCGRPPIILVATQDKKFYVNNVEVVKAELEECLIRKTVKSELPKIILRMDSKLTIQELMDILSIGEKNHITIQLAMLSETDL